MQITSYFYHSNSNPYCITFLNDLKGLVKVIVAEFGGEDYWIYPEDVIDSFVISYDELVNSPNLYKTYVVSILATANPFDLTSNDLVDQNSALWTDSIMDANFYVETRKLHKGIRFNEHYSMTFGFDVYPVCISISDSELNDKLKSKYLSIFADNESWLVSCNSKTVDDFIINNMDAYLDFHVSVLEYFIQEIESSVQIIESNKKHVDIVSDLMNLPYDINTIIMKHLTLSSIIPPI
jgi:hypothetical protein